MDAAVKDGNGLFVFDARNGRVTPLDNDARNYNRLAWNDEGTALAVLKGREEEVKGTLAAKERKLQESRNELSGKSSRLHSLQELEAQFAGYGQGVRNVFQATGFKERFRGVVADLVETGRPLIVPDTRAEGTEQRRNSRRRHIRHQLPARGRRRSPPRRRPGAEAPRSARRGPCPRSPATFPRRSARGK